MKVVYLKGLQISEEALYLNVTVGLCQHHFKELWTADSYNKWDVELVEVLLNSNSLHHKVLRNPRPMIRRDVLLELFNLWGDWEQHNNKEKMPNSEGFHNCNEFMHNARPGAYPHIQGRAEKRVSTKLFRRAVSTARPQFKQRAALHYFRWHVCRVLNSRKSLCQGQLQDYCKCNLQSGSIGMVYWFLNDGLLWNWSWACLYISKTPEDKNPWSTKWSPKYKAVAKQRRKTSYSKTK